MSASEQEGALLARIDYPALHRLLQDLVRIPSPNPPGTERDVVRRLEQACRELGFAVETEEVEPGRPNLYACVGDVDLPGLLLLVHTDTVPVGSGWTRSPTGGEIEDGRLYGRGSADMKAGIAAAVAAMSAVAAGPAPLPGHVMLAAVVDEEESGKGARALLRRDLSRIEWAIVPEPTEMQTIIACRGNCYVEVEVRGKAAHAGSPEQGSNAIYGAARAVEAVRRLYAELQASRHPLLGSASWSVGTIEGGSATAIVPDTCRVTMDRRLLPGETGAQARAQVERALQELELERDGLSATATLVMEMPGFELDSEHPLAQAVRAATVDSGGADRPPAGWTAACDGGFIAADAKIPTLVLGPGSVVNEAHQADESVELAEVDLAARTFALTISRLLDVGGQSTGRGSASG
jgi:acetylornithine deacetylase/succinyl-diaminopimelate desuccinylase family protein